MSVREACRACRWASESVGQEHPAVAEQRTLSMVYVAARSRCRCCLRGRARRTPGVSVMQALGVRVVGEWQSLRKTYLQTDPLIGDTRRRRQYHVQKLSHEWRCGRLQPAGVGPCWLILSFLRWPPVGSLCLPLLQLEHVQARGNLVSREAGVELLSRPGRRSARAQLREARQDPSWSLQLGIRRSCTSSPTGVSAYCQPVRQTCTWG